jgi:TonB family protein
MIGTNIRLRAFVCFAAIQLAVDNSSFAVDQQALAEAKSLALARYVSHGLCTYVKWPVFPEEARAKHLSGSGFVVVYPAPDGSVERVEIARSSGHKILDDSALAAFSQWRFIPGKLKKLLIPFTFRASASSPKTPTRTPQPKALH